MVLALCTKLNYQTEKLKIVHFVAMALLTVLFVHLASQEGLMQYTIDGCAQLCVK